MWPENGLPDGWSVEQSGSRPGELVFENIHTGERIPWRPRVAANKEPDKSEDIYPESNLPGGWVVSQQTTKRDVIVYENTKTKEQLLWPDKPQHEASDQPGKSTDIIWYKKLAEQKAKEEAEKAAEFQKELAREAAEDAAAAAAGERPGSH